MEESCSVFLLASSDFYIWHSCFGGIVFSGNYEISEVCIGLPLVKNVVAVKLQTNARRLKIDSYALPSFQLGNTLSSNPASIVNIVIRVNQPIDDIVHTYLQ